MFFYFHLQHEIQMFSHCPQAELNELLKEDEVEVSTNQTEPNAPSLSTEMPPVSSQGLLELLIRRIDMYRNAIRQAATTKAMGRARRYRRGLKV